MLKAHFERVMKIILFNFKSKFVKTRIIIDRKPAKGHVFNNKQDSHFLSTNINNSRFDLLLFITIFT